MKGVFIAFGILAVSTGLFSCGKKDRYCECTTTINGKVTTSETPLGSVSSSTADDQCSSIEDQKNAVNAKSTNCYVSE